MTNETRILDIEFLDGEIRSYSGYTSISNDQSVLVVTIPAGTNLHSIVIPKSQIRFWRTYGANA
jgi:hypothetical protein